MKGSGLENEGRCRPEPMLKVPSRHLPSVTEGKTSVRMVDRWGRTTTPLLLTTELRRLGIYFIEKCRLNFFYHGKKSTFGSKPEALYLENEFVFDH